MKKKSVKRAPARFSGELVKKGKIYFSLTVGILVLAVFASLVVNQYEGMDTTADSLTGAAATTTSVSVTINSVPTVYFVGTIASQTVTEKGVTGVSFLVNVSDPDGFGDINTTAVRAEFNLTGEVTRFSSSCGLRTSSGNSSEFNCTVYLWYFDGFGNWSVNVSAKDNSSVYAQNATTSFELQATTGIQISPQSLTFPAVELGATNKTANNDPILINNTANADVLSGSVTVTARNLQGKSTTTEFFEVTNFTTAPINGTSTCIGSACTECGGSSLTNGTAVASGNANVTAGNNSLNYNNGTSGQEQIFFCIKTVPSTGLSRQTFDTTGSQTGSWTITITG